MLPSPFRVGVRADLCACPLIAVYSFQNEKRFLADNHVHEFAGNSKYLAYLLPYEF